MAAEGLLMPLSAKRCIIILSFGQSLLLEKPDLF